MGLGSEYLFEPHFANEIIALNRLLVAARRGMNSNLIKMMDYLQISLNLTVWRDWSGLPGHLLLDIADKFTDIEDYIHFGRVCISWQSIVLENLKNIGSPLLLVDPSSNDEDYHNRRALYSPSRKSVCNFEIQVPHSKFCRGSSFGWLITMDRKAEDSYHIQLQNPFLNRTIDLPPLDNIVELHPDEEFGQTEWDEYLWRATLSCDPSVSDEFIVMGIMSQCKGLAYFKPGKSCWTPVENVWSDDPKIHEGYADVIFFHKTRRFYAILLGGAVVAFELRGDEEELPKLTQIAPPLDVEQRDGYYTANVYLVEDLPSGDLLQVRVLCELTEKAENGKHGFLNRYTVFKLNPSEQSWTQIYNLGAKVLFIADRAAVLRNASDCPGCQPNCVYYSTYRLRHYNYIADGIYNLEDGTVQQHYVSDKHRPSTIWLESTLSSGGGSGHSGK